jgi:S1-C subfamily serine protease
MEDNKRDYSDFFKKAEDKGTNGQLHDNMAQEELGEERRSDKAQANYTKPAGGSDSYYYSYGPYKPYKPARQEGETTLEPQDDLSSTTASATDSTDVTHVEVTAPRPMRPFGLGGRWSGQQSGQSAGQQGGPTSGPTNAAAWQYPKKRRSNASSVFAAFLAGALVVGSLMFAADKMNLFTGTEGYMAGSGSASHSVISGSGSTGGVKTTALDMARPNNISGMVDAASPAVVKIETFVKPKARSGNSNNPFFNDPFFRQFFGDGYGGQAPQQQQPQQQGSDSLQPEGMGSGFIYKDSGYILTNEHVIDGADQVQVTVQGYSKKFTAKVLGSSYDYDLAVLKIEGDKPFETLPLGNVDDLNVGDWVVAIGNPYGFDHTVTVGVLSAKERPIDIPDQKGDREYKHLLQTDASINPGNSGGPLLNLDGQVIGINTAVSAQAQGIGFAIPTTTITSLLEKLESGQKIPKEPAPFIGVALQDIDKSWVTDLQLDGTDGTIVSEVQRNSPAFKAGIRQYDVIVGMNGDKVTNSEDLSNKVKALKVGDKATFTIVRNGKQMEISVTIGDRNADSGNQ